jgi:hypothetical protein
MESKIITANGIHDLSKIHNLKDIQEEILFLKSALGKEEDELEEYFRRLPSHAVKSAADSLLPSFLNKILANGTWKILLSGLTMFANPFSKGYSVKKNIVGATKKLGLIALLKGAYSYWRNTKNAKAKPVTELKNSPSVTTLKTKNFRKS